MFAEQLLFFIVAIGALAGALGVVLLRNPFYSVLSLVSHLISLALLFLLLRASFLAAAQVVVYASAVIVLYLFVVAYVGGIEDDDLRPADTGLPGLLGPIFAAAIFLEIAVAVVGSSLGALDTTGAAVGPGFGSPGEIGALLLTRFLLPFEAASFLLLLAAVAAIVLARKRRGLEQGSPGEGRLPEEQIPVVSVGEVLRGDVG